jgi:hypothetical protein
MGDKLSNLVFRRDISIENTRYTLDSQMIRVLAEMNGTRTLGQVAERLDTPMAELEAVLVRLYRQGLIVQVKTQSAVIAPRFIRTAETHLAHAIGPIAPKVIAECIRQLGHDRHTFPATRTKELVEQIASKIGVEQKKMVFLKAMAGEFNEYFPHP